MTKNIYFYKKIIYDLIALYVQIVLIYLYSDI